MAAKFFLALSMLIFFRITAGLSMLLILVLLSMLFYRSSDVDVVCDIVVVAVCVSVRRPVMLDGYLR